MAQSMGAPPGATTGTLGSDEAAPDREHGRDQSREPNRERILAVALEEFADKGFEGTTTAEIARRAQVTQPLVHYHFDSKDDLWRAALQPALDQLQSGFAGSASDLADLDPVAKLKVLVRRFVQYSAAHPELGRILAYEGANGGARLDWLLGQEAIAQFAVFGSLLDEAVTTGMAKPLPAPHVAVCLGVASAYVFVVRSTMATVYGIDVEDPDVIATHADTVVELFFHGLVATDATDGAR